MSVLSKYANVDVMDENSEEYKSLVKEAAADEENEKKLQESLKEGAWRERSLAEKIVGLPLLRDFFDGMDAVRGFGIDVEDYEAGTMSEFMNKDTVQARRDLVDVLQGKTADYVKSGKNGGVGSTKYYRDLSADELAEKKQKALDATQKSVDAKTNMNLLGTFLLSGAGVLTGAISLPIAGAIFAGGAIASKMYGNNKMNNTKNALNQAEARHLRKLDTHGAPNMTAPKTEQKQTFKQKKSTSYSGPK